MVRSIYLLVLLLAMVAIAVACATTATKRSPDGATHNVPKVEERRYVRCFEGAIGTDALRARLRALRPEERISYLEKALDAVLLEGTPAAIAAEAEKERRELSMKAAAARKAGKTSEVERLEEEASELEEGGEAATSINEDAAEAIGCAFFQLAAQRAMTRFAPMLRAKNVRSMLVGALALRYAGVAMRRHTRALRAVLLAPGAARQQNNENVCGMPECYPQNGPPSHRERCAAALTLAALTRKSSAREKSALLVELLDAVMRFEVECLDPALEGVDAKKLLPPLLRAGALPARLRAPALRSLARLGHEEGGIFAWALGQENLDLQLAGLTGLKRAAAVTIPRKELLALCAHTNSFLRSRLLDIVEAFGKEAADVLARLLGDGNARIRKRAHAIAKRFDIKEKRGSVLKALSALRARAPRHFTERFMSGFGFRRPIVVFPNPMKRVALVLVQAKAKRDYDLFLVGLRATKGSKQLFKRFKWLFKRGVVAQECAAMEAFWDVEQKRRYAGKHRKDTYLRFPKLLNTAWSPDGERLALSEGTIGVYRLEGARLVRQARGIQGYGPCSGFAHCNLPFFHAWSSPNRFFYRRSGCCGTTTFFTYGLEAGAREIKSCEVGATIRYAQCAAKVTEKARYWPY